MIYKDITYTDYNGVTRTERHWFHLSKAELTDMEMTQEGSLTDALKAMVNAKDKVAIYKKFVWIITRAYGVRSEDGRRFMKGENFEYVKAFMETEAYSVFLEDLLSSEEKVLAFVQGIMPNDAPKDKLVELQGQMTTPNAGTVSTGV